MLVVVVMAIGIASFMITLVIFLAFRGEALPGVSSHLYVATMDSREVSTSNSEPYVAANSLMRLMDAKALVSKQGTLPTVAVAKTLTQVSTPSRKSSDFVHGMLAYGQVAKALGVVITSGRSWTVQEQQAHAPVALISSQLAEKLFATVNVLGKSIKLNGQSFRIIGITKKWKPRFQFIRIHGLTGKSMQVFLPVGAALDAGLGPITSGACGGGAKVTTGSVNVKKCRWLEVWSALHNSTERASYQRYLANYAKQQQAVGRFVHPAQAKLYSARHWIDLQQVIPPSISLNLAISTSFLLLCLFNAICLLTTRFMRSRIDTVVRRALG
ncbi:MAG: ABC transporter permease, partial [Xanthomonadales bacterium]|nr:ABC transporter permease [Xanthomonadales bacterium]